MFVLGFVVGVVAGKFYPQLFAALRGFYDRTFKN